MSRGAGVVTLVEHDRRTAALIRDNVRTLGSPRSRWSPPRWPGRSRSRRGRRTTWSSSTRRTPCRPPTWWRPGGAARPRLARRGRAGGRRAVHPRRPVPWPEGFEEGRSRKYGETTLWYGHAASPPPRPDRSSPPRRSSSAPSRVPRVVRPGHQRSHRHHRAGLVALRRGRRRRAREQVEAEPVHRRGADRHAHRGVRRLPERADRLLPTACSSTSAGSATSTPSSRACAP